MKTILVMLAVTGALVWIAGACCLVAVIYEWSIVRRWPKSAMDRDLEKVQSIPR